MWNGALHTGTAWCHEHRGVVKTGVQRLSASDAVLSPVGVMYPVGASVVRVF